MSLTYVICQKQEEITKKLIKMRKIDIASLTGKDFVFSLQAFAYLLGSSCPEVFYKIGVPKNFVKFSGKNLCWSLFFKKVMGWMPATLLKRDFSTQVFCESVKFLRTSTQQNISKRTAASDFVFNDLAISTSLYFMIFS